MLPLERFGVSSYSSAFSFLAVVVVVVAGFEVDAVVVVTPETVVVVTIGSVVPFPYIFVTPSIDETVEPVL